MARTYPLHLHITTLFLLLLLAVSGTVAAIGYRGTQELLAHNASTLTARVVERIGAEVKRVLAPAETTVNLVAADGLAQARTLEARLSLLPLLRRALDHSDAMASVYVGYADGDFFMLRAVRDVADRDILQTPAGTRYMVQSIERSGSAPRGAYLYYDANLQLTHREARPAYPADYDPRARAWYRLARERDGLVRTVPYVFFSNRKVGTTLAMPAGSQAVVGVDITLAALSQVVAAQQVTASSEVAVISPVGEVIAHAHVDRLVRTTETPQPKPVLATMSDLGSPAFAALHQQLGDHAASQPGHVDFKVGDRAWRASIIPLWSGVDEGTERIATVIPEDELMGEAITMARRAFMVSLFFILLTLPIIWLMARKISRSIRALVGDADAIRNFDFDKPISLDSPISEVLQLAQTMASMKRTIRRFLDISQVVAAETDFDQLLPRLLGETISATHANAGVLYLADGQQLKPVAALAAGEPMQALDHAALPTLSLAPTDDATPAAAAVPTLAQALGGRIAHAGVPGPADAAQLGLHALGSVGSASQAMAVPLINRREEVVGAMLILHDGNADPARLSFAEALSGTAAVTLETRELIRSQRDLFEAFIQLIAGAIDAKSPYTGGHCARVPELTKMLAKAACDDNAGPWRDFSLDAGEWEAVHVAAWLHDCGKITSPETIVDKATKLEGRHDRIHEIRMRFEVLKRDAQIACLQAQLAGTDAATADAACKARLARIDEDFTFVADCNIGAEFMDSERQARLRDIATQTWLRTLDDRLGISHEEATRLAHVPPAALPATEALLADKPEHVVPRGPGDRLAGDARFGFRMTMPIHLYNRGELHNLSVSRGTLTEEDRFKVNEHILQTIVMLDQLPFPKHLRAVPELAGGHHEKMDGSGYPKGLARDDMSPVARMMAVADVFEALTAADRPYKRGLMLSESLRIMSRMVATHHLDADVFDLFLRSGVYLDYANRFMNPQQVDAVDLTVFGQDARI